MKRLLFLMILSVAISPVFAGTLGVDFTSPGTQNSSSVWSLGYQFVANSAVSVVGLGTFDYNQDGFSQAQQVGLWDSSGNLLASTYVDNTDPLQGFWRFAAISPVTLVIGDTYYVASQGGEGYTYDTSGFTVDPSITYVLDAWHYTGNTNNSPLAFPDTTDSITQAEGGAFFGGNIELGSSVPEPSSLALFGLGLAVVGLARRRLAR